MMTGLILWFIGWGFTEGFMTDRGEKPGITSFYFMFFWPLLLGRYLREQLI